MSAAVTAATTASIVASQNAQREHEKKVYECSLYVEGFEHNQATVEQIQIYTECAELLYPVEVSHEETVAGKACVFVLLVAMVIGVFYGWKEDKLLGALMFGFMFPVGLALAVVVVLFIASGVAFLLS